MQFTCLDAVTWEPATVSFYLAAENGDSESLERFIDRWLKNASLRSCSCRFRFASFAHYPGLRKVLVNTEWVCPVCVQALANAAAKRFSIKKVELGVPSTRMTERSGQFVTIPSKSALSEDGQSSMVQEFTVGKAPVSVGEFRAFQLQSGYVTLAEQQRAPEIYRENQTMSGVPTAEREHLPAYFISYWDALAFCTHYGFRLPTESEWLAAAVYDWTEYDLNNVDVLDQLELISPPPNSINCTSFEWTASRSSDGLHIVRRGPLFYLSKDWRHPRKARGRRRLVQATHYDIEVCFRVIRSEPTMKANE